MARAQWPLRNDQPSIQVSLALPKGGQTAVRSLVADTGAGTIRCGFDLLLYNRDCLVYGFRRFLRPMALGGAYSGRFPVYLMSIQIPLNGFDRYVPVVGVDHCPAGFDGIACFSFLSRFSYGNFGDPYRFVLEN